MEIAYICYASGVQPAHKYETEVVNVDVIPLNMNCLPRIFRRYNLLISEGLYPLLAAYVLKRFGLAKKHIHLLTGPSILSKKHMMKIIRKIYKNCDCIIANSRLMAEIFRKYLGENTPMYICHPYYQNISDFTDIIPDLHSRKICFVGQLIHRKGIDLLPRILTNVRRRLGDVEMYVVGFGRIPDALKVNLKGLHVTGYLPKNKLLSILSCCSVYVHPARFEPFGMSVVEAMAAGLIPIVTKMTGAKDLVESIDSRLVVPVDEDAIANRIIEILRMSPGRKRELSKKAKQIATIYSVKARATFIKALKDVLGDDE